MIYLCCEGIDILAEISINGRVLASTDNMHRTYEFDIRSFIKEGKNSIKIILFSPLRFAEQKHNENPLWGSPDAVPGFPHMRKAHYMFGWDWGPQIPDCGIWRNIHIKGYTKARIEDVYITQHHCEDRVSLSVNLTV